VKISSKVQKIQGISIKIKLQIGNIFRTKLRHKKDGGGGGAKNPLSSNSGLVESAEKLDFVFLKFFFDPRLS